MVLSDALGGRNGTRSRPAAATTEVTTASAASRATGGGGGSGGTTRSGGMGGSGATSGGGGSGGMSGGSGGGGGSDAGMCGDETCATGEMCVDDECRKPCSATSACTTGECCDGFCTDTDDDRANCGECDNACESSEMCDDGECEAAQCTPEEDDDGGTDPDVGDNGCPDNEECVVGGSGNVCQCGTGPGCPADESCGSSGMCLCGDNPGCESDENCCGDDCLDLSDDEDNCGQCGNECGEDSTCTSGKCTCATAAETACADGCFDLDEDEDNCGKCGNECADGATCNDGECDCPSNQIACDGECVSSTSNTNCGECDNACNAGAGQTCQDPAGSQPRDCYCFNNALEYCPQEGVCVDLDNDEQNCGTCGHACNGPANVCRNGDCECPDAGETPCGNECVNLTNDPDHCGECDLDCDGTGATGTCANSVCSCTTGAQKYCDTNSIGQGADDGNYQCITANTVWNCGQCDNRCVGSATCNGTQCVCAAGQTYCPDQGCVSTASLQTDETTAAAAVSSVRAARRASAATATARRDVDRSMRRRRRRSARVRQHGHERRTLW